MMDLSSQMKPHGYSPLWQSSSKKWIQLQASPVGGYIGKTGDTGYIWQILSAVLVLMILLVMTTALLAPKRDVEDEQLHYDISAGIAATVSDFTGSILVGRVVAEECGYVKEAIDALIGSGWSDEDIQADAAGIASIY
jgi:hypothetical protein